MPLFLANGVTGVRDMCSDVETDDDELSPRLEEFKAWRDAVEAGTLRGPRLVALSSFVVNGRETIGYGAPEHYGACTAADARRLVHELRDQGIDFIKVYARVPREGYFALLEEAGRVGLPVAGHKPFDVPTVDVVRAGQRSVEHVLEILFDFFPGAEELRDPSTAFFPIRRAIIDEHDRDESERAFDAFVAEDTYFTPTLLTRRADALSDELAEDPRLEFLPPGHRREWAEGAAKMDAYDPSPAGRRLLADFYELALDFTGRAHRAGVPIMAGTDAGDTYCLPGFGLHDELEELVKAGLSPGDALRAATLLPARFLGRERDHGNVAAGMVADLVLLEANPLEDIRATTRIDAVVFGGELLDRAQLDAVLAGVKADVGELSDDEL
jgi:hypothetical protein